MVNNLLKQSQSSPLALSLDYPQASTPLGTHPQFPNSTKFSPSLTSILYQSVNKLSLYFVPAWPMMLEPARQDDLPKVLARSFMRAWERYYLSDRGDKISEEVARPSLAKHLVGMANDGVHEEDALAAGGFQHLISLGADEPSWRDFPPAVAHARFLHQWKIRMPFRSTSG